MICNFRQALGDWRQAAKIKHGDCAHSSGILKVLRLQLRSSERFTDFWPSRNETMGERALGDEIVMTEKLTNNSRGFRIPFTTKRYKCHGWWSCVSKTTRMKKIRTCGLVLRTTKLTSLGHEGLKWIWQADIQHHQVQTCWSIKAITVVVTFSLFLPITFCFHWSRQTARTRTWSNQPENGTTLPSRDESVA